jgi:hypothetical protein
MVRRLMWLSGRLSLLLHILWIHLRSWFERNPVLNEAEDGC